MKKQILLVLSVLIVVLALVGCGSSATPAPQPTPPPVVITVIITATPLPVTATPPPPAITAVPTVGETKVALATDVAKSSASASSLRPTATATRRVTAVTPVQVIPPTATLVPNKYPGPSLIGPVFDESLGRKDSRSTGEDLVFNWHSVGGLGTNECYAVRIDVAPGQGDQFLLCDLNETQKGPGVEVRFVLWRPNRGSPNFSSLLTASPSAQTVSWYVTVVRDDGPGGVPATGAFYATDGQRHKITPLSPRSSTYSFPLNGGL